uniref:Exonuclease 3'-5' domain-containing protein 2-like n=1 Tax=Hirondellea gigas TaxID=1518452 RepID=A0A6A7FVP8_9CRUS
MPRTGVATAAAAAVLIGGSYALYRTRYSVSKGLWRKRLGAVVHTSSKRVVVVENQQQWEAVEKEFVSCCSSLGCIGFDCEWVVSRPVALLQLATHTGLCVLFRLCKLKDVPQSLKDLLRDPTVLKVGVAPADDCRRLWKDHGIIVNGALDLREFFHIPPSLIKTSKKKTKKKYKSSDLKVEVLGEVMQIPEAKHKGNSSTDAGATSTTIMGNTLTGNHTNVNDVSHDCRDEVLGNIGQKGPEGTKQIKNGKQSPCDDGNEDDALSTSGNQTESKNGSGFCVTGMEQQQEELSAVNSEEDEDGPQFGDSSDTANNDAVNTDGDGDGDYSTQHRAIENSSKANAIGKDTTISDGVTRNNECRNITEDNKIVNGVRDINYLEQNDNSVSKQSQQSSNSTCLTTNRTEDSKIPSISKQLQSSDDGNEKAAPSNTSVAKQKIARCFSKGNRSAGNKKVCACGGVSKGVSRCVVDKIMPGVKAPLKLGLSSLAQYYLRRTLDKDWRVRASDWEVEHLTHRQIIYAAEDARSGLHVMLVLLEQLNVCCCAAADSSIVTLLLTPLCSWPSVTKSMLVAVAGHLSLNSPAGGWDTEVLKKYNQRGESAQSAAVRANKGYRRAYSLRKTPLYHNSLLWAPDNEPLCTVDPKKAYWYVNNDLGEVVQEEPLIVRLTFEPTGRPQKEGSDGYFYLNERQNMCVVCGKDWSYIRKNIIPHEYRKHFPEILKSHQNHDVVLLCTDCHQLSNQRDSFLRYKLADRHNAPIGNATDVKVVVNGGLKVIKSAGNALERNSYRMPASRIKELQDKLKEFFQTDDLTPELISKASVLDVVEVNSSYEPHGLRVYKYYEHIGIIHFEKLWRENFLETMNPEHMPDGWSVTHNHAKLKLKMARYPLDDPAREQFKLALVGREGNIDVPHIPQKPRARKTLPAKSTESEDASQSSSQEEDNE